MKSFIKFIPALLLGTLFFLNNNNCFAQLGKVNFVVSGVGSKPFEKDNWGVGGQVKLLFGTSKSTSLSLSTGFESFLKKKNSASGSTVVDPEFTAMNPEFTSDNIIPIKLGFRKSFGPFFLEPQLGVLQVKGAFSNLTSDFKYSKWKGGYGLQTGVRFSNIELAASFNSAGKTQRPSESYLPNTPNEKFNKFIGNLGLQLGFVF